ncbi:MAG: hypothetical protein U1C74_14065, partial [Phenylobacterium sp.]|nr:hypothetical protein [Phenylobacterium sp.]
VPLPLRVRRARSIPRRRRIQSNRVFRAARTLRDAPSGLVHEKHKKHERRWVARSALSHPFVIFVLFVDSKDSASGAQTYP